MVNTENDGTVTELTYPSTELGLYRFTTSSVEDLETYAVTRSGISIQHRSRVGRYSHYLGFISRSSGNCVSQT